jgi:hypothetical protein
VAAPLTNPPESPRLILLPGHLAEAIEWVLRPTAGPKAVPPDLSRLTSQQMQVLPLPVAQDFMELALATPRPNNPHTSRAQLTARTQREGRPEGRNRQRARRDRQRVDALTAAHERLYAWYIQTASAQHRRFAL